MKTATLFTILIAGFALSNMEEAYAMNVDKNLPMGNAVEAKHFNLTSGEDIKINGDVVHFAAQKFGSPQSMWFGFRINGVKGKKLPACGNEPMKCLAVVPSVLLYLSTELLIISRSSAFRHRHANINQNITDLSLKFPANRTKCMSITAILIVRRN